MASASKVASGPMMTCTWLRSMSSWVLVFACAGLPPARGHECRACEFLPARKLSYPQFVVNQETASMMYSCAPASSDSRQIVKKRGKSLRVDIHCHYLNTEAAAAVARHNPAQFDFLARFSNDITREVNAKQVRDRAARLTSIETRLKDMDRMGIDVQAIAPAPHQTYYWCEPGEGAELARMVNERLAHIVAATPERFVALGTVPLQDAGLAVAELEYGVKKLGLRGVEINPSVKGVDL